MTGDIEAACRSTLQANSKLWTSRRPQVRLRFDIDKFATPICVLQTVKSINSEGREPLPKVLQLRVAGKSMATGTPLGSCISNGGRKSCRTEALLNKAEPVSKQQCCSQTGGTDTNVDADVPARKYFTRYKAAPAADIVIIKQGAPVIQISGRLISDGSCYACYLQAETELGNRSTRPNMAHVRLTLLTAYNHACV